MSLPLILTGQAFAQAQVITDCPPPMEPMSSTVRLPDSGVVLTVAEFEGDTRKVVSSYEYTQWLEGLVGTMQSNGEITFTNKTEQNRRMKYRISVLLPNGSEPQIPDGSILCWEAETNRIIAVYESAVPANEEVVVPVAWDVMIRKEGMLADLNGDNRVDGVDQAIMLAAFGTNDTIADLNGDGFVDAADLGILLANWSDYSEDVLETSDAGPNETPEFEINSPFINTADYVIAATLIEDPVKEGNGNKVPFLDWQWRA